MRVNPASGEALRGSWPRLALWLALLLLCPALLAAAPGKRPGGPAVKPSPILLAQERYRVNAQVRSAVRKSTGELGEIVVRYLQLPGARLSVRLAGDLRDPEDGNDVYRFEASVDFSRRGRALTTRSTSRFSEEAEEYREQLLELVPFLFVLKYEPWPAPSGEGEAPFTMDGKSYLVRWVRVEKGVEATLYEGLRTVGKFFLREGPLDAVHEFDKFRINTVRSTVLSFVR
jgi:hypothetical protein